MGAAAEPPSDGMKIGFKKRAILIDSVPKVLRILTFTGTF